MRKKITTIALVGVLGVGAAAVASPAIAASDTSSSASVGDRLSRFKDALKGLVSDGTITQEQADKVATTLNESVPQHGPGGHGGRGFGGGIDFAVAAEALGITEDELRTQLEAGKSLADIAESKSVDKAALIDKLVAAAEARLAQAVTDGKLTQAQADEMKGDLKARITDHVDQTGFGRGDSHGHGGHGRGGFGGERGMPGNGDANTDAGTDSGTSAPSAEATTSSFSTV